MIRAKIATNNTTYYVYVYSIYFTKDNVNNEMRFHYLCSSPYEKGLKVYFYEEFVDIEYSNDNLIDKEYTHPILNNILNTNWQLYEDLVEGVEYAWLEFEKQLGYRP